MAGKITAYFSPSAGAKVKSCPAVGILCDEPTDAANLKQLAVFVHCVADNKARTFFLRMVDIPNGLAETIESKILEVIRDCDIPITKVYGFGSDGANVMTGKRTGVATRMKAHNTEMISIHCGAHKVALASSQAAADVPYMKTFDSHLITIYYHFENSSVREAALHQVQKVLGDPVLCLKKAIHTRWLSHDQAITAIRRTLPSLLATLEQEVLEKEDAVANGLLRAMKSYKFVATVYLLSDVLPSLTSLSLLFQQESVDFSVIQPQVAATISSLKSLRTYPGPNLQQLGLAIDKLSKDFKFVVTDAQKKHFQRNVREAYIDKVIENLEGRFADVHLLASFSVLFSSEKAAAVEDSQMATYGDSECDCLAEWYTSSIEKATLKQEWLCFKHILKSTFTGKSTTEVMLVLSCQESYSLLYLTLSKLANIAITLPILTAYVERSFSTMNRIKSDSRNRLKSDSLDRLIRISSEGPPLEDFDYDQRASKNRKFSQS